MINDNRTSRSLKRFSLTMPKVIIYSTPTCPFCHSAKEFLKENKVDYEEKDVSTDQAARAEMLQQSGQMGVPVIDINGQIIVGFDREKIKQLLNL